VYIVQRREFWARKSEPIDENKSNASNTTVDFPNPDKVSNDSGEKELVVSPNEEQALNYSGDQGGQFSTAGGGLMQY